MGRGGLRRTRRWDSLPIVEIGTKRMDGLDLAFLDTTLNVDFIHVVLEAAIYICVRTYLPSEPVPHFIQSCLTHRIIGSSGEWSGVMSLGPD